MAVMLLYRTIIIQLQAYILDDDDYGSFSTEAIETIKLDVK
jgi:hypothetical protein